MGFNIPIGKNGDCYDRYLIRIEEMKESNKIIKQCIKWLKKNKNEKIKNKSKISESKKKKSYSKMECLINHFKIYSEGYYVPKNEIYTATEHPKGEFGILLLSNGTNKPYRMKIRFPGFNHISAIKEMIKGHMLSDVPAIIA